MALNKPTRYVLFALVLLLAIHFLLSATHEPYGNATSLSALSGVFSKGQTGQTAKYTDSAVPAYPLDSDSSPLPDWRTGSGAGWVGNATRANATFVMLARNTDVNGAVQSIRSIEDRFNREHGYPYVFLNEEEWTDEFKKRISVLSNAPMEFGVIPHDWWFQPDWIDEDRAAAGRKKMEEQGIIYAGSVSYRNMCRFNSGFFFKHEMLMKYKWYWRIEPDVMFHCTLSFDPFKYMEANNKVYAFTIALYEWAATIPTLWDTVKDFMKTYPEYVASDNAMGFMSENGGQDFNMCHFWSNFEIADMDFWRGEVYTKFFEFLDKTGGFYYERWGDAPVHSMAAGLFLPKSKIHFFNEIGYEHPPNQHCPQDDDIWKKGMCSCDQTRTHGELVFLLPLRLDTDHPPFLAFSDYGPYSCQRQWDRIFQ
ncbi:Glycosyltransferase family 15 protein [Mycena venus]|uniref:Glycosyltransferase family 15 protein n=1 Tax=Mycena venus TaxID=2733690 RepID=A0A8H6Y9C9_9AGAR|nr:Glycosyltransferase family 15 protein [Mycena venus]